MTAFTVAQQVKGVLVRAGCNSEERLHREEIFGTNPVDQGVSQRIWRETARCNSAQGEYFTSVPYGEGAVISYSGSVHREEERLHLYRLVLENCSFSTTEEDDPQRKGRKVLKVTKS